MARNSRCTWDLVTRIDTTANRPSRAAASNRLAHEVRAHSAWRPRVNRTGATTRTPMASPVHHTVHAEPKSLPGMAPETTRVTDPTVALMVIPSSAPRNTMAAASRRRSISRRKPTHRNSVAAASGARVFPAAVTAAASGSVLIGRFTRNAASATPGHTDRRRTTKAARAMPLGGHRGVTFRSIRARWRLKCAAT
jgi:hypothetical protein